MVALELGALGAIFGGGKAAQAAGQRETGLRKAGDLLRGAEEKSVGTLRGAQDIFQPFQGLTTDVIKQLRGEVTSPSGGAFDFFAKRGIGELTKQLSARGLSRSGAAGTQIGDFLANLSAQNVAQRQTLLQGLLGQGAGVAGQQSQLEQLIAKIQQQTGGQQAGLQIGIGDVQAGGTEQIGKIGSKFLGGTASLLSSIGGKIAGGG